MALQLYYPGMGMGIARIKTGECRIDVNGNCRITRQDLLRVGIEESVVIEFDQDLRRVVFRPAPEDGTEPAFPLTWTKNKIAGLVRVKGLFAILGMRMEEAKGVHAITANGRRLEMSFGVPANMADEAGQVKARRTAYGADCPGRDLRVRRAARAVAAVGDTGTERCEG